MFGQEKYIINGLYTQTHYEQKKTVIKLLLTN